MRPAQPQLTQIVRAERADAFSLAALQLRLNREQGRPGEKGFLERYSDAWIGAAERRPAWLARSLDGRPLGCAMVYVVEGLPRPGRAPRPWVHLTDWYVVLDSRRQGLGDRLLRAALAWAGARQAAWVHARPEESTDPMWRAYGFGPAAGHLYHSFDSGGAPS